MYIIGVRFNPRIFLVFIHRDHFFLSLSLPPIAFNLPSTNNTDAYTRRYIGIHVYENVRLHAAVRCYIFLYIKQACGLFFSRNYFG